MNVSELTNVVVPPETPLYNRGVAPTVLPHELLDVIAAYGSGYYDLAGVTRIEMLNPFDPSYSHNLRAFHAALSARTCGTVLGFRVFPEAPGLLRWAKDDRGGSAYYYTEGQPDEWPIFFGWRELTELKRFDIGTIEFLVKALGFQFEHCITSAAEKEWCRALAFVSRPNRRF